MKKRERPGSPETYIRDEAEILLGLLRAAEWGGTGEYILSERQALKAIRDSYERVLRMPGSHRPTA